MTYDEFYRTILNVLPSAALGEDNDGQLVIYTDMYINDEGKVVPMENEDLRRDFREVE
jgi:hypothetical protein